MQLANDWLVVNDPTQMTTTCSKLLLLNERLIAGTMFCFNPLPTWNLLRSLSLTLGRFAQIESSVTVITTAI
jgi:hypothetical protein